MKNEIILVYPHTGIYGEVIVISLLTDEKKRKRFFRDTLLVTRKFSWGKSVDAILGRL